MRESKCQAAALVVRPVLGTIDVADPDMHGTNSLRKAIQGKAESPLDMQPDSISKDEIFGANLNEHVSPRTNPLALAVFAS